MSPVVFRRLLLAALGAAVVASMVFPLAALTADVTVATVPSGPGPVSVAVNPVTGRVYTANYNGSSVGIVDGTTDSLVTTLSTGINSTFPDCVVVDPLLTPARVFVGNFWNGTVTVIDESSTQVTATLSSGGSHGGGPRALALDAGAATPKLFVADYGTDTVSVFNAATNALITRIPVGDTPRALGIFVSVPRRRVFVANRASSNVSIIDAVSNSVVATAATGAGPKAIAVDDSTGFAYVTNETSNTVTVIDANDEVTATVDVGMRPVGIAVDAAGGRVFVANFNEGTVSVIRTSDFTRESTIAVGTNPWSVAVDSSRRKAFVTNYGSGSVSVIASDLSVATATVGYRPYALAVNNSVYPQKVYVGNFGSDDLTVLANDGFGRGGFAPEVAYAAEPGPVSVSVDMLPGDVTFDPDAPVTGTAHSARPISSAIAAVLVSIDGGAWERAVITSGSGTPDVAWRLVPRTAPASGAHTVRALAFDETGAASSTSEMGSSGKSASQGGSAVYGFEVLASTRYEQTDPKIDYAGTWTTWTSSKYSGRSMVSATGAGTGYTFAFDGTAARILAYKAPVYGKARVTIDGGAPELVDLYSPTTLTRQSVWSRAGLAPGPHTVNVEWTGLKTGSGSYISLDAIDVVGTLTTAPVHPNRYEQTDPRIAFTGVWTTWTSSTYSGRTMVSATGAGSGYAFTFDGTAADIIAYKGPVYGKARVTIDGGAPELVDLYSATILTRQTVWSRIGLAPGPHTVTVEWTGLKTGSRSYISLDAIDVVGTLTP